MITRRDALAILGAGFIPQIAAAQPKPPVLIGWLSVASPASQSHYFAAFKESLDALGWQQGSRARIEHRWAHGRNENLPTLARELAATRPVVIVTAALRAVRVAIKAMPTTPIIVASAGDLIAEGFAVSLARPAGMVTGVTNLRSDVAEKYVELLLAAAPHLTRLGFIVDSNAANRHRVMTSVQRSVKQRTIKTRFVEVGTSDQIDSAMSRLVNERVNGVVVMNGFFTERQRIMKLALAQRWPVIGPEREFVEDGALVSYSVDTAANYRRAAYYVDRVLKGAKAGDLPIEQPTKFELVINMKTAKALGINIPPELLLRADRVIE
jgi:putative tryptophan/tyrosine transport system substrate-binding protein